VRDRTVIAPFVKERNVLLGVYVAKMLAISYVDEAFKVGSKLNVRYYSNTVFVLDT
jgi:hypothetical protein